MEIIEAGRGEKGQDWTMWAEWDADGRRRYLITTDRIDGLRLKPDNCRHYTRESARDIYVRDIQGEGK